ncbi:ATP-binding protein [Streptomyces albireticuli]|uniref:ATP-binding protein n=1 Tax=Streptomyces albireticuli TaxID=1940 RepID=A0A2A2D2G5_9ACTN|nr:ATP-binding protein [Streptomyces albireticuli]MCD9195176.1 ATP-binding protein [Streptomyces albireticuli]PAU46623.1 ATP-binding protein [Streptomyces albireticuli]
MKAPATLPYRHVLTLPTVPASVSLARRTAQVAYSGWDIRPSRHVLDAALLMLSELVTNSVRHAAVASPQLTVTYAAGQDALAFAVHDRHPHRPDAASFTDGPGGLGLIGELTTELGGAFSVLPDADGGGKNIWIVLPTRPGQRGTGSTERSVRGTS